jgi:hypothetical protein
MPRLFVLIIAARPMYIEIFHVLEKRLKGQGLNGGRAHRAAETDALL